MKKKFIKATITASLALMMTVPSVVYGATDYQVPLRGTWEDLKFGNCTELKLDVLKESNLRDWLMGMIPIQKPELDQNQKPENDNQNQSQVQKPEIDQNQKPENNNQNNNTGNGQNSIGSYEMQVLQLVNAERAKAGLSALTYNTKLAQVAEVKAEDMMKNNYFSHTSPTYGSPFEMMNQFGIQYSNAGENIAMGQQTPESVMNGWMNSSGHRANILSMQFEQIGVGYVKNGNTTYWVQMFIR